MQLAVGKAKKTTGIFMGAETINQHGKSLIFAVPNVSLYDQGKSDSLISAGRLKEAGYNVNLRIPDDVLMDGFAPATFPLYGGSITTPDNLTVVVVEYAGHTWLKVQTISRSVPVTTPSREDFENIECFTDGSTRACNRFAGLPDIFDHDDQAHVPDFLSTEHVEGHMQQRFELVCRNKKRRQQFIEHMATLTIAHFYSTLRQQASRTSI